MKKLISIGVLVSLLVVLIVTSTASADEVIDISSYRDYICLYNQQYTPEDLWKERELVAKITAQWKEHETLAQAINRVLKDVKKDRIRKVLYWPESVKITVFYVVAPR